MVTIKKLLCIILLITLLIANILNMQICYADSTDGNYSYSSSYSNLTKLNNHYYIYDTQGIDYGLYTIKENLLNNDNVPFLSRYNSGFVHIDYSMYIMMRPQYQLTSSFVDGSIPLGNVNPTFEFDTSFNNQFTILNPQISVNVSYRTDGLDSTNVYFQYYEFSLHISFDTYLKDLLLNGDTDTSYLRVQCLDSGLGWALFNNNGQPVGYKIGEYFRRNSNAIFKYTLDNPIKSVNRGAFGFDFYQYDNWTGRSGFNDIANFYSTQFNNVYESGNSASYFSALINYNIDKASLIKSMDTRSIVLNDWQYCNDNWQQLYNESLNDSGFTFNNTRFDLRLDMQPPIFTTDSQPVVNPYNDNQTRINLSYYDAKWYEIHLQLANAFIFMITEFPLISDITNLIYSLFVMIKASFDVLLEFNGFGILFAFGMFAIVFAFIYKLIVGD